MLKKKRVNGTSMDKTEMMNTTFEEVKRKAHALHVQVVGWTERGSP